MTNKPMLSVDRELLESFAAYVADCPNAVMRARVAQLRAILGKPEYPRVSIVKAHAPTCACVVGDSGQCDCGAVVDGVAVEVKQAAPTQRDRFEVQCAKRMVLPVENVTAMRDGDTYTVHAVASHYRTFQAAEQPAPVADHPQCEECKGWGYHENHHEGGGTECGECGGSGKAAVAPFSADTVVCRRYQLEQSPGQNFYHYDLEPVYGSVPVTISEMITLSESAPVAVVMPSQRAMTNRYIHDQEAVGWNACLAEVARLNGMTK